MLDISLPISTIDSFINRWERSAASERSNYVSFIKELCDLLDIPHPDPATGDPEHDTYVFERSVHFAGDGRIDSTGFIDLYKKDAFVLEAKQGSNAAEPSIDLPISSPPKKRRRGTAVRGTGGWDTAMTAAKGQAERYIRALPATEGNPPFIVIVDVGHTIELHSDFSRAGKTYIPFPDSRSYRIKLADLARPEIRERLRALWLDPMSLDPSRHSARVTRDVAARLAALATSLERSGYEPQTVAAFLMRCIFTMFAEDVRMIPERTFTNLLAEMREDLAHLPDMLSSLWSSMNTGGFSPIFRRNILRFNGGLFADNRALPLTREQLDLLIDAGRADWRDVEPSIFGTLLERALDPVERHKLGAHYTPRAYVERLVMPTVVEPLREEWNAVQAAALTHMGKADGRADAIKELREFHRKLCSTRVLDPACGTGNFLYVTMEHMKRLEGEVLDMLKSLGVMTDTLELTELTVDPHQFLGIEINPRAAAIADLVLWIGYLQWHFRTHGDTIPREPVLRNYHNIECRDAVLAYDRVEPLLDDSGTPITRWDGRTFKKHPATGRDVPDETARVPVLRYINPRKAEWPDTEYIVGNPPFLGPGIMRSALGDGYTQALRETYSELPDSIDYVMYWWDHAARVVREGQALQFGFITTNSLRQTFNRRIIAHHLEATPPLSIIFAIPDHPWVDAADGAAVRISITTGTRGQFGGELAMVLNEFSSGNDTLNVELGYHHGHILPDLRIGINIDSAQSLRSNTGLASPGVKLHGAGFIITRDQAQSLGIEGNPEARSYVREYRNGRDITSRPRELMVIDLFGLTLEQTREQFPEIFQWLLNYVKPEREQNSRATYRENWWIFGEPRTMLRESLRDIGRYISTVETSKHRFFLFLGKDILPDNKLVNIAIEDACVLGILSSRIHITWTLAQGSQLGPTPVYVKTTCFDPFPFPVPTEQQKSRIRDLGEQLDAHRKRQQELHPTLTITDMYNVLEKLRAGEALTDKDRKIHEQGLVSLLKQIHDDLDAAVFAAYGWPGSLTDEEILERLVALNAERAREEQSGLIRWLRPEFQNPKGSADTTQRMTELDADQTPEHPAKRATGKKHAAEKRPWPSTLREQAQAVRSALAERAVSTHASEIARLFDKARKDRVTELLATLADLGQVRKLDEETFAP